jgi:hypothetical protein
MFQIGAVSLLVFGDLLEDQRLLCPPAIGELFEEVPVDDPFDFVDVDRVKARLQPLIFGRELLEGLFMLALFIRVAFPKAPLQVRENIVAKVETGQGIRKLRRYLFFTHKRLTAVLLVPGAMIVDVAALLNLTHHSASAMAAFYQAGKRKLLAPPNLGPILFVEHILDFVPEFV